MDFLNHREGGYGFLSGFPPFSFSGYSRNCKKLSEFEEKSQGKAVKMTVISSKNSALGADSRPTKPVF